MKRRAHAHNNYMLSCK